MAKATNDSTTEKKTRQRRSPAERAQADLDKAQKSLDKATDRLDKLNGQIDAAEADVARAERLVDFLSRNPDLPADDAEEEVAPAGDMELQPA